MVRLIEEGFNDCFKIPPFKEGGGGVMCGVLFQKIAKKIAYGRVTAHHLRISACHLWGGP